MRAVLFSIISPVPRDGDGRCYTTIACRLSDRHFVLTHPPTHAVPCLTFGCRPIQVKFTYRTESLTVTVNKAGGSSELSRLKNQISTWKAEVLMSSGSPGSSVETGDSGGGGGSGSGGGGGRSAGGSGSGGGRGSRRRRRGGGNRMAAVIGRSSGQMVPFAMSVLVCLPSGSTRSCEAYLSVFVCVCCVWRGCLGGRREISLGSPLR